MSQLQSDLEEVRGVIDQNKTSGCQSMDQKVISECLKAEIHPLRQEIRILRAEISLHRMEPNAAELPGYSERDFNCQPQDTHPDKVNATYLPNGPEKCSLIFVCSDLHEFGEIRNW